MSLYNNTWYYNRVVYVYNGVEVLVVFDVVLHLPAELKPQSVQVGRPLVEARVLDTRQEGWKDRDFTLRNILI